MDAPNCVDVTSEIMYYIKEKISSNPSNEDYQVYSSKNLLQKHHLNSECIAFSVIFVEEMTADCELWQLWL